MLKNQHYKFICGIIFVWFLVLLIFGFFTQSLSPKYLTNDTYLLGFNPAVFFKSLTNWDGGHYIGIAEHGYEYFEQYAFFPLYPILIKIIGLLFRNYQLAAVFISIVFLIMAIFIFDRLIRLDYDKNISLTAIIYFLIFPTAFFLIAAYSEAFFLFTILSAFYFARKNNFLLASLFVSLASATRPIGILLSFPIIYEYLNRNKIEFKTILISTIYLTIGGFGFLAYLLFLQIKTGNPLVFISAQAYWQRDFPVIPFDLIGKSYLILFSLHQFGSHDYAYIMLNFLAFFLPTIIILSAIKKIRKSYLIYSILMIIIPVMTGSFNSLTRFLLPVFPIFIILATWGKNPMFDLFYKLGSIMLFGLLFTLFLNNFWIA